jgi:hypothetical protein
MADLVLAHRLGEALQVAIAIRDGMRPARHAVVVVDALNCWRYCELADS